MKKLVIMFAFMLAVASMGYELFAQERDGGAAAGQRVAGHLNAAPQSEVPNRS